MKVKIKKGLCIGCGTCISLCPDVFELDKEGKSTLKKKADLEENKDCIIQAVDSCPVQAISSAE